ncbi:hypothetical protein QQF64_007920 [Cirrhinus molitorella]|uniref:Uncharacterized protein n=1 Tax=Cirrhinus molitorella TaxID=172907 RepID=A0ABR3M4P6_9TELE
MWVYFCNDQQIQSSITVFMKNLVAADFFLCLCLPLRIAAYANNSEIMSNIYCSFGATAFYINMYASIFFMDFIAANSSQLSMTYKVIHCVTFVGFVFVLVSLIVLYWKTHQKLRQVQFSSQVFDLLVDGTPWLFWSGHLSILQPSLGTSEKLHPLFPLSESCLFEESTGFTVLPEREVFLLPKPSLTGLRPVALQDPIDCRHLLPPNGFCCYMVICGRLVENVGRVWVGLYIDPRITLAPIQAIKSRFFYCSACLSGFRDGSLSVERALLLSATFCNDVFWKLLNENWMTGTGSGLRALLSNGAMLDALPSDLELRPLPRGSSFQLRVLMAKNAASWKVLNDRREEIGQAV